MFSDEQLRFLGSPLFWAPGLSAFLLALVSFPGYIKLLKSKQFGQYVREDGPKSHSKKQGTPTAGGVCFVFCFLIAIVGASIASQNFAPLAARPFDWRSMLLVGGVGVLCGLVGLIDDVMAVKNRKNDGLSPKLRLLLEFTLGIALGLAMAYSDIWNSATAISIPGGVWKIDPVFSVPFCAFLIAATTNAVNLTDGLDGLSAGTGSLVFAIMALLFVALSMPEFAIVAMTACLALLGFLFYNRNPAKVFMGDTGSLFLGGLMGALVAAGGLQFWFIPLSLIYIIETVSVMMQVGYFKLTKEYVPPKPMAKPALVVYKLTRTLPGQGKRLFRMAPIHHHFEAVLSEKGLVEWQVVAGFWAVQVLLCAAVLTGFYASRH